MKKILKVDASSQLFFDEMFPQMPSEQDAQNAKQPASRKRARRSLADLGVERVPARLGATDFVLYDRVQCNAEGLFRNEFKQKKPKKHKPGDLLEPENKEPVDEKPKDRTDVTCVAPDGTIMRFESPSVLTGATLRVYLGIIAAGGIEKNRSTITSALTPGEDASDVALRESMGRGIGDAPTVKIDTFYRTLARDLGYKDLSHFDEVREEVHKLAKTSITLTATDRRDGIVHMISNYEGGAPDAKSRGRLVCNMNPRVSEIVLGTSADFRWIEMSEIRAIKRDATLLIYVRLCGWVEQGAERMLGIKKLTEYLYPKPSKVENTINTREREAQLALGELKKIGWEIVKVGRGKTAKFLVTRPKRKNRSALH